MSVHVRSIANRNELHRRCVRVAAAAITMSATLAFAAPAAPQPLPTAYEAHRFYLTPVTRDGKQLRCYSDSGGGGVFLFSERVHDLGFATINKTVDGETMDTVAWPDFRSDAAIPAPASQPWFMVLPHQGFPSGADCFLGQSWFGGRVWTFDYPGRKLWLRAPGDLPPHDKTHEARLTFKTTGDRRDNNFPRIEAIIDGETIPLLFDTGAMVTLSPAAQKVLGDGPTVRGGSFITQRTFDKWRKKHPDWRVIADADDVQGHRMAMIEVPAVTVGGYSVGPAWFAARPDGAFDKFMSGMMSAHVEGALGGSALHYLRVTVDYVNGVAVFAKP